MRRKSYSTKLKPPFLKRIHFPAQETHKDFPFTIPLFKESFDFDFERPITILVGENGTGKSTLLELIAHNCGFNVLGGSRNHAYASQGIESSAHLDVLASHCRFSWLPRVSDGFFLRAETFFNFLEYIISNPDWPLIEQYYGGQLLQKSHGEAFLAFFANRISGQGVYLFDEPEAALSPRRQIEFLKILQELEERGNAQVIMVTHSPLLMAYPNADIRYFGYRGARPGQLEETEHFRILRDFFSDPQGFVKREMDRT